LFLVLKQKRDDSNIRIAIDAAGTLATGETSSKAGTLNLHGANTSREEDNSRETDNSWDVNNSIPNINSRRIA
jgi:hypothetical protein